MLNQKHIIYLFIFLLTFLLECRSETNKPIVEKAPIVNDSIPKKTPPVNKTETQLQRMGLINVKDSIPEILVELKYAGTDNFLKIDFYGELKNAFLQVECFKKLKNAYKILQETNPSYSFIIYDAVRSIQAQQLMWDSIDVPLNIRHWYVANPALGSIHNYGMAIDLTICDSTGLALDMGTEFDFFGDLAFPDKTDSFYQTGQLSSEQYKNRKLLLNIMAKAGFYVSKTEWWHYNASSLDYAKGKYKIFSYDDK